MKVTFKVNMDREKKNFDEEKRKLNKLLTQVAKTIAIEKRGIKGKGYYYIYYTNPLNHKNYRGNTYIWDYESESFVELKFEFIGKRSSLFRVGNIFYEFEWDWTRSDDHKAVLSFVPNLDPKIPIAELQRASVEFTVYEYHTSAPSEWGLKWFEELRPCHPPPHTDGDEGYYTPYNLDELPVIGSEEEIKRDTEKCAIIYDHLHHRPRAIVPYFNIYSSNPPWWVEEQLR
jgi:hypothetical protein